MVGRTGVILLRNERIARHTAWRTGGDCDAFIQALDVADFFAAVEWCRAEGLHWTILGAGTRTVGRDSGFSGAMIRLGGEFQSFARDGERYTLGAAAPAAAVAMGAAENGLSGLEDWITTTGTVGAALALDKGGWTSACTGVRYAFRGKEKASSYEEFTAIKGKPVVFGATFQLSADRPEAVRERTLARLRGMGRGTWTPPGSWLVPPKKASLREVLERAGLRDIRLREVLIPAVAPEMLVNLGGGTARDLALLHQSAIERTAREVGVDLESRICWLGRA